MKKNISLATLALICILGIGYFVNESSKEYIDGNILHLPWSMAHEGEPRLGSPWVNNGIIPHIMYRTLMIPDHTIIANFKPNLASKIEILDNGLTYKVHFNNGSKWSDGVDITLDDVLYSIDKVVTIPRANTNYQNNFDNIASKEVDGNILTLRLAERSALFQTFLCQLVIMPKHATEDISPEEWNYHDFWLNPIVSGMYKIKHYEQGKFFELEHNELYTGKKPKIETVMLHYNKNNDAKVDYYFTNNISEMINFRAIRGYSEFMIAMNFYRYLVFNIDGKPDNAECPLKDVRLRQAIALSLDRKKLLHDVYMNTGYIVNGAGVIDALGPYNYNPTKAKELIAETGFDTSRPIIFGYYYTDATSKNFMEAAAAQIRAVGFNIEIMHLDIEKLYTTRPYDFYLKGFAATRPSEWYNEYLSTNSYLAGLFGHDGSLDEMINELAGEADPVKHNALISELSTIEQALMYKYPLFTLSQSAYINTDRVKMPKNFIHGNYYYNFDFDFANWEIKKN